MILWTPFPQASVNSKRTWLVLTPETHKDKQFNVYLMTQNEGLLDVNYIES